MGGKKLIKTVALCLVPAIFLSGCFYGQKNIVAESCVSTESAKSDDTEETFETDDKLLQKENIILKKSDYVLPEMLNQISSIEELYCKDASDEISKYVIDAEGQLWAAGYDDYGQLGIGTVIDKYDIRIENTPQKVFEHVLHVMYSGEYFAAFITEKHELYGMGANLDGVLCMPTEESDRSNPWQAVSSSPRLLMEDVKYAVCTSRMILALKEDDSVWLLGGRYSNGIPK